ncbi:biotin-dependent carboxyltransferase family protein [Parapedobacter sp. DT-150]|uniref:5-oxoprolinase subunit C family protein n=1 Tax=Parapedobacter sp. DT-150 TaxID=3396162 RepID=UPI003F1B3728
MQIRIHKAGFLSTVQDSGRWGYLARGVPLSGAMDTFAMQIANLAVGNPVGEAVIEFTFAQAAFEVEEAALLAYSGGGATLLANGCPLPADRPVYLPAGTQVCLQRQPAGCRTYLAVAGGWDVPAIMASKSTYLPGRFGGYEGRTLQAGDRLRAGPLGDRSATSLSRLQGEAIGYPRWAIAHAQLSPQERHVIRVVPGHEFAWFSGQSLVHFLSERYQVSGQSDRMGYRLQGPPVLQLHPRELLSTAVTSGTIQVTGDGSLILLMADCQTTGGYPRIAQVAAVDAPRCAQLKPGEAVYFREISRFEAEKLYLQRAKQLQRLSVALALQYQYTDK